MQSHFIPCNYASGKNMHIGWQPIHPWYVLFVTVHIYSQCVSKTCGVVDGYRRQLTLVPGILRPVEEGECVREEQISEWHSIKPNNIIQSGATRYRIGWTFSGLIIVHLCVRWCWLYVQAAALIQASYFIRIPHRARGMGKRLTWV